MGTEPLVFAFFLIIFQVVTAVLSGFPGVLQPQTQPGIVYQYPQEIVFKNPGSAQGISGQPTNGPNYISLNDISEMQLPRPPTENEVLSQGNVLSGAGNLETNDIVKNPSALPKSDTSSIAMQNNAQPQTSNGAPANNMMTYSELDKAVEDAVNSLPSGSEYPLVPLIKVYKQRIEENLKNEDMNQEELARKKFFQKNIVLKLAKKIQKLKDLNDIQTANENIIKELLQAQTQKENPTEVKSESDNNGNDCDCEGGCMVVVSQSQPEPEMTRGEEVIKQLQETKSEDSVSQSDFMPSAGMSIDEHTEEGCLSEDKGQRADNKSPELLGHLLIMLKVRKLEDEIPMQNVPQTPFPLFSDLPLRSPEVSNPSFTIRLSKNSVSLNTIPMSALNDGANPENLLTGLIPGGYVGNDDDENDRESGAFVRLTANEIVNDSDDSQSPVVNIVPSNQMITSQGIKGQNILNNPKGLFLWKILREVMKQKAAAEAFRGAQENQMPSLLSTGEIPTPSLPQGHRIVILTKGDDQGSLLPPMRFPDENSGANIQFLSMDTKQDNSESNSSYDSKRKIPDEINNVNQGSLLPPLYFPDEISGAKIQFLSTDTKQDNSERNNNSDSNSMAPNDIKNILPAQEMNTPQDLPWFIRNIIKNLNQQHEPQPVSTPAPSQNGDGDNLVLLRAMLAPYTL